ncbi:uncharacterized protein LOC126872617 [Bombus huntii]|uniref:uncharacterized protein LOC126872617 n=1 Tax=Bombus huntii TaxID=85661 RepID=UPI0021A9948B|nr:uncharacterized protein LOC126872617 [Bombus huntii]
MQEGILFTLAQLFDPLDLLGPVIVLTKLILQELWKWQQLHNFSDASKRVYGASMYIRSTDPNNNHKIYLLGSKSQIVPLKTQTLPGLELCAAMLLNKLFNNVIKALNVTFQIITFWSDSTIEGGSVTVIQYRLNDLEAEYATHSENQGKLDDIDEDQA